MRYLKLVLIFSAAVSLAAYMVVNHVLRQRTVVKRQHTTQAENALPQRIAWIWERPEDLHTLDPATAGVAVLEGTLHLNDSVVFTPRLNAYVLPRDIRRIAVVRMEAGPRFGLQKTKRGLLQDAARRLILVAHEPGIAALQIDFDARRSERAFYRNLLDEVRGSLPADLPLEMTALVSWCAEDDWIADLPVDSATPMFFRMEPGRSRLQAITRLPAALPEPLCNRSVGVSTHEPWPINIANRRVYIFADHGWKSDLPLLAALEQRP